MQTLILLVLLAAPFAVIAALVMLLTLVIGAQSKRQ
jgi:hypothetical protein